MSPELPPAVLTRLGRLAGAGIEILPLPGIESHFALRRGAFAVLVERRDGGFGATGSAGLITPGGLAVLVWRGEAAAFVNRAGEIPATAGELAELREFAGAVEAALHEPSP